MSTWLTEVRAGIRFARARIAVRRVREVWCAVAHEHAWRYFWLGAELHRHCPICEELRDG